MSIVSSLLSGGVGQLLTGVGSLAKDLREAITGDISPEKKAEIEEKLTEIEALQQKAQTDINLAEAKSSNTFIAGARPYILWVCGTGLLYASMLRDLLNWGLTLAGLPLLPPADTHTLTTVLFSVLGLGGYRTFEKIKGVNGNHS